MRVCWVIIDFDVTKAGQVVEIEKRMPSYCKKCAGILLSVFGHYNTTANKIPQAGIMERVAINDKTYIACSFPLGYAKGKPVSKRMQLAPVGDDDVAENSRISIQYKDSGRMLDAGKFVEYKVKVYLKCLK